MLSISAAQREATVSIWLLLSPEQGYSIYTVAVVVDSHIQRIVLATGETTVTQQVSHRPIKCQSRLWIE